MPADEKKTLIAVMKEEIVLTLKAMQPEIAATVEKQINATVNGKINAMRDVLDGHVQSANEHRDKVDEFIQVMTPALDGIRLLVTLRRFAVWLSGFGIIGTIIWLGIRGLLGR